MVVNGDVVVNPLAAGRFLVACLSGSNLPLPLPQGWGDILLPLLRPSAARKGKGEGIARAGNVAEDGEGGLEQVLGGLGELTAQEGDVLREAAQGVAAKLRAKLVVRLRSLAVSR